QHANGLAIDLASFKLSDGTIISVNDDWEPLQNAPAIQQSSTNPCRFDYTPTTEKGKWLYDLVYQMCDQHIWSIILTPDYNTNHPNHLHVDLTSGHSHTFIGSPSWTVLRPSPGGE